MSDPLKILFLARWYPNRYDPMPGLFIQRHAEAVSRYCKVGVVYTHVVEGEKTRGFDMDFRVIDNVPTAKIYYTNPKFNFPLVSPIIKLWRFYNANSIGIRKIRQEIGGFNLIHVHVLTRLGIIAYWYKWMKGIPYVISEHWSRYLPLTGKFRGGLRKWITRLVVKNAASVTTVTRNLANAMQSHGLQNGNYRVLANVVTDDFFQHQVKTDKKNEKTTFLHVSCFEDKSKNISGLLHVIRSLSEKRNDFVVKMVGDGMDFQFLKQYAHDIRLDDNTVVFTGLLEGKALVKEMASADLMVVFSNYENFPVVINESFVLGIPVVATSVGGIPEFINDDNGRLILAGDQKMLEKLLTDYLEGKLHFDPEKIRAKARNDFSPETIGKQLYTMYKGVL